MHKHRILPVVLSCLLIAACAKTAPVVIGGPDPQILVQQGWQKSADQRWQAHNGDWVKLDKGAVVGSVDSGKTWEPIFAWEGEDAKAYQFNEQGMLMASADQGKSWQQVPSQTWPGKGGVSYKVDRDGTLWKK